jgi:hypothetical protein
MKQLYIYIFLGLIQLLAGISCTSSKNDGMNVSNSKGGSLAMFTTVGNYLYTVKDDKLTVFNLVDPAKPVFSSEQPIGANIETIFPYNGKLFIGSGNAMYIYELNNAGKPELAGTVQHLRSCDPVVAAGNTAYVTLRAGTSCGGVVNALMVYDVTDIKNPVQKVQIPFTGPYGLGVSQQALYICDGEQGLVVMDITAPLDPQTVSTLKDATYYDVIPYGETLICYVANGVCLYDISSPLQPVLLSKLLK